MHLLVKHVFGVCITDTVSVSSAAGTHISAQVLSSKAIHFIIQVKLFRIFFPLQGAVVGRQSLSAWFPMSCLTVNVKRSLANKAFCNFRNIEKIVGYS